MVISMSKEIDIDVFWDWLSNFLRMNPLVTLSEVKDKFLRIFGNVGFCELMNLKQTKDILSYYGL